MRFFRAITRLQTAAALTLFGIAIGLLPLGLEAIGYQLSVRQGYAIFVVAGLFVAAAVFVFFWPWITGAWGWIRRDTELKEAREAHKRLEDRLREVGEERDALQRQRDPRQLDELKGLCVRLAWELQDLDRMFRHTDAAVDVRVEQSSLERKRALSEEEKATFGKRIDELRSQHDAEMVRMYHDIYKDRVMGVYEDLAPRGWFGTDDRDFFQNLDDPWNIVEVGNRLERVANDLP